MHNLSVAKGDATRTYVFPVELFAEADGRWSAICRALPGCATWGASKSSALQNIENAIRAYVEDLLDGGEPVPHAVRPFGAPAITITL